MADPRVIAVLGATGAQGGGLVRAILDDQTGRFSARAITRDPSSSKAEALAALGAEVVQADLDDEASLVTAFTGAHGAFCVTNFWEKMSPTRELAQAAAMARAADRAGLNHVVWSTLEDMRQWVPIEDERLPTLMGCYKVPHYDAKSEANAFFTDADVPTTFFQTSHYWDNMVHLGMGPRRGDDGVLGLAFPLGRARLPGIAAADIGHCAFGVFEAGDVMVGQTVSVAGDVLDGDEMASGLAKVLGEEVRYDAIDPDDYRGLDFLGAVELGNMFQAIAIAGDGYCMPRDPSIAKSLNPSLQSYNDWCLANAALIPLD